MTDPIACIAGLAAVLSLLVIAMPRDRKPARKLKSLPLYACCRGGPLDGGDTLIDETVGELLFHVTNGRGGDYCVQYEWNGRAGTAEVNDEPIAFRDFVFVGYADPAELPGGGE